MTEEQVKEFINSVIELSDDNRSMALLKRGLRDHPRNKIYQLSIVDRLLPYDANESERQICAFVSSIFALHKNNSDVPMSFAKSVRMLADATKEDPVETRFMRLVSSDREEAMMHVAKIMQLLASKGIPVHFESLILDLKYWSKGWSLRSVQGRWSRDFFSGQSIKE